jgi:arsenate reductase (thioredoxin)
MAAALLRLRSDGRIAAVSGGSAPAGRVNPVAVEAMRELGVDLGSERPRALTDDAVRAADVVVTMGCGDSCPVYPGKRYEDWPVADPAGGDLETVRRIREEIDARVERLVAELLS